MNIERTCFVALLVSCLHVAAARAGDVWLDSLELKNVDQDWGKAQAKKSVDKKPISIAGKTFDRGVGTHVDSEIHLSLDGQGERLTAAVGVDDEVADHPVEEVTFEVVGDGKSLWKSAPAKPKQPPQRVDVSVAGVKDLTLLAHVAGDNISYGHVDWADAKLVMNGDAKPKLVAIPSPPSEPVILTPKPPAQPRINGRRVYGERTGRPFLYTIPATGERPMTFSADGLPAGLQLDEKTGRITGKVDQPGEHAVTIKAINARGTDSKPLKIVIGDNIALTPPLGWNSWNCWAEAVDQEKVMRSAKAMVDKGLINHGWTYINIDDTWQGQRGGEFNGIQPNEKFPDMKKLADEVHGMGLKLGIYSTPWITSYAGFCGGSSDDPQGKWDKSLDKREFRRDGKHVFADADAKQWAQWGIDYLKYDWNPRSNPAVDDAFFHKQTQTMGDALKGSGRDILYSYSNSMPFDAISDQSKMLNAWRTTGDIRDTWKSMSGIGFNQDKWVPYAGPGHWNDPDMLVVGYVGWGPRLHPSQLTPDEQYTHISLWSLLSAPLLIGCDMDRLDDFTVSLLSNDEVLAIDQDSLGKQAKSVSKSGDGVVYAKELEDGGRAVGLFNRGRQAAKVTAKFSDVGVSGKQTVRDLWRQKDVGNFDDQYEATVPPHGVVLVKLTPAK